MKQSLSLALLLLLCGITSAAAQDLVITNVRVIVGNGTVINQGTIVVRGGRISSVSPGRRRGRTGARSDDRRARRDGAAGIHRRPSPREHGPQ